MIQTATTYLLLRRYNEAMRAFDRAIVVAPDDPRTRIYRAGLAFDAPANIKPYQKTLDAFIQEDPGFAFDASSFDVAFCERKSTAWNHAQTGGDGLERDKASIHRLDLGVAGLDRLPERSEAHWTVFL
jgi:hypothetical protein